MQPDIRKRGYVVIVGLHRRQVAVRLYARDLQHKGLQSISKEIYISFEYELTAFFGMRFGNPLQRCLVFGLQL
jgi:hypothetical protein